jgi:hypothetical protein
MRLRPLTKVYAHAATLLAEWSSCLRNIAAQSEFAPSETVASAPLERKPNFPYDPMPGGQGLGGSAPSSPGSMREDGLRTDRRN